MAERIVCDIPLNRVEGDLEIRVAVEDGRVVDAWSSGTLYRGFENLLTGRAALDALMITPRICGICTTTHLHAAAKALDALSGVVPPANAIRLRNVARLAESVQSDLRQAILMFLVDFCTPAYAAEPWFAEACARYAPLRGSSALETIRESKRIVELIAVIGGQWPHSSFMVPGGVTNLPNVAELNTCRAIVDRCRRWFERQVLGGRLERWQEVDSLEALERWLAEAPGHAGGDLGWLLRLGRAAGLDALGAGCGRFLSHGVADDVGGATFAAGVAEGVQIAAFDPRQIAESIAASHYEGYTGLRHPFDGITRPLPPTTGDGRYSYAKAPRYGGAPMETGPLAEAVVAGEPLFVDWVARRGASALARQAARLSRPARLLPLIGRWLDELVRDHDTPFIVQAQERPEGEACGLINAARGALGHWVKVAAGRISHYQIVTPTAWNGSPRDDAGVRGPWEEALVGTPIRDPAEPVEAGHVIRSFDPCLVCTVHAFAGRRPRGRLRLGAW